jgi:hypothetical protein
MADIAPVIQEIQYLIAPAVMVSSAALLLLGLQGKLSNIANRFRALNHEKRLLDAAAGRDAGQEARLRNLRGQVDHLLRRAGYTRRAVVLAYTAIICFTGTSVLIFATRYAPWMGRAAVAAFMAGLGCILGVAVLMIRETRLLYRILTLEHSSVEPDRR